MTFSLQNYLYCMEEIALAPSGGRLSNICNSFWNLDKLNRFHQSAFHIQPIRYFRFPWNFSKTWVIKYTIKCIRSWESFAKNKGSFIGNNTILRISIFHISNWQYTFIGVPSRADRTFRVEDHIFSAELIVYDRIRNGLYTDRIYWKSFKESFWESYFESYFESYLGSYQGIIYMQERTFYGWPKSFLKSLPWENSNNHNKWIFQIFHVGSTKLKIFLIFEIFHCYQHLQQALVLLLELVDPAITVQ